MFITIMIIIIIICIIGIFVTTITDNDKRKNNPYYYRKSIASTLVDYVGGYSDILERKSCNFAIYDDEVRIRFPGRQIVISYNNVIDIDGKNEEEMRKDVTLTRLLLFGIFAFGMKKKTCTNRKFVILKYKYNDKVYTIIFETPKAEQIIRDFNKYINQYKIKRVK